MGLHYNCHRNLVKNFVIARYPEAIDFFPNLRKKHPARDVLQQLTPIRPLRFGKKSNKAKAAHSAAATPLCGEVMRDVY